LALKNRVKTLQKAVIAMDEKYLLSLWNVKRTQVIAALIPPTLILIALFVVASLDVFATAPTGAKILTLSAVSVTGSVAIICQYAAVREAQAVVLDLQKIDNPSALTIKVSKSGPLLKMLTNTIIVNGIATFGIAVWVVSP
jgi:hypothetical protein